MTDQDTAVVLCGAPDCTNVKIFDTVDGPRCFVHAPDNDADREPEAVAAENGPAFSVDVVAGLAAMILDHAAMTMTGADDAADAAMRSLAEASAMPLDFAAGVLLALTTVVAAGEVSDEQLTSLAERFEAQAEGEAILSAEDGPAVDAEPCDLCGERDHTTLQHEALYPLPTDGEDRIERDTADDDE